MLYSFTLNQLKYTIRTVKMCTQGIKTKKKKSIKFTTNSTKVTSSTNSTKSTNNCKLQNAKHKYQHQLSN